MLFRAIWATRRRVLTPNSANNFVKTWIFSLRIIIRVTRQLLLFHSRVAFESSAKSIAANSGPRCRRFSVLSKLMANGIVSDRPIISVKISILPPVVCTRFCVEQSLVLGSRQRKSFFMIEYNAS
jgi:hypothetical protein